jgi:hypothetical protein
LTSSLAVAQVDMAAAVAAVASVMAWPVTGKAWPRVVSDNMGHQPAVAAAVDSVGGAVVLAAVGRVDWVASD